MSSDFWDARYATDDYIFGTAPNVFLASQAALIQPGMQGVGKVTAGERSLLWIAGHRLFDWVR
ncbi:MAG: hypothetical protein Q8J60_08750, partial [Thiobacillus sp.]|nr:hypothetical protein [Thiobacillus sp.]